MNTDVTTHDPTANGPPVTPTANPELARWYSERDTWFAELQAIRAAWSDRQYPDQAEITADWKWVYSQINAGAMRAHLGKYVAVYQQAVAGTDTDALRLELAMARQFPHLHPDRFVIAPVG